MFLRQNGQIIDFEIVSEGGITSASVDVRRIFREALKRHAVSIVVSHNHPSGSLQPSIADEALTAKLNSGSKYLDIKLLDHVIIGEGGYFSFADEGKL
jgi:DNA repair protein RadC